MMTSEAVIPQTFSHPGSQTKQNLVSDDLVRLETSGRDSYVLIVDDDPDAREVFCLAIRSMGLASQEAKNGIEALEMIRAQRPALILLDLMMPLMDGFQVLTHLRSDPRTRTVPVVVVTGIRDGVEMLRLPGVTHVLVKGSYKIAQIRQLVAQILAGTSASVAL